jgi:ferredoxin
MTADRSGPDARFHLSVDPWRCQGHMQCVAVAPDLFVYDDELSHAAPLTESVEGAALSLARRAAAACPEHAISLTEGPER